MDAIETTDRDHSVIRLHMTAPEEICEPTFGAWSLSARLWFSPVAYNGTTGPITVETGIIRRTDTAAIIMTGGMTTTATAAITGIKASGGCYGSPGASVSAR